MNLHSSLQQIRAEWDQRFTQSERRPLPVERAHEILSALHAPDDGIHVLHDARGVGSMPTIVISSDPVRVDSQAVGVDVFLSWSPGDGATVDAAHAAWTSGLIQVVAAHLMRRGRFRTVRLSVNSCDHAHAHPATRRFGPSEPFEDEARTALEVRLSAGVSMWLDGVMGDVAAVFGGEDQNAEISHTPGARWTRVDGNGAAGTRAAGVLLGSVLCWWAGADPKETVELLRHLSDLMTTRIEAGRTRFRQLMPRTSETERFTFALEAALAGIWQLRPLLGDTPGAREELEGWQRETEVLLRLKFDSKFRNEAGGELGRLSVPARARVDASAWGDVFRPVPEAIPSIGSCATSAGVAHAHTLRDAPLPVGLFDGERTLAEVAQKLVFEVPTSWDDAVRLIGGWINRGAVVRSDPPDYSLGDPVKPGEAEVGRFESVTAGERSRTVLYLAYGSCMCRYSFRETVPRFTLVGAAKLDGYRLGYTLASVRRGGGAADVVPDPGKSVWGILYRVPREYLPRLDEREGVFLGRYERTWVDVKALGVSFAPVLTYTVVDKAPEDIPPSDEYAGLIWDGARGMLDAQYCRDLERQFQEFDVEPTSPF